MEGIIYIAVFLAIVATVVYAVVLGCRNDTSVDRG